MQSLRAKIATAILAVGLVGLGVWQRRHPTASGPETPGVTANSIRLGSTGPYSGDFAAYSIMLRAEAAYFKKVNAEGGIHGRQIDFRTIDDAMLPARTVEATRQLVEQDQVLAMVSSVGTPTSLAVRPYLNEHKIPQLFVMAGDDLWSDPKHYPWTMPGYPPYSLETAVMARHLLKTQPNAKVGVLYENDEYGKGYREALLRDLGERAKGLIVAEQTYEPTDVSVQSQVVNLKNANVDVLFDFSTPRYTFQAIKKMHELGWKPTHFLASGSSSTGYVMSLVGAAAEGAIAVRSLKDPTDPQWAEDPGFKAYAAFCKQYYPDGEDDDAAVVGYNIGMLVELVLRAAGPNLTREGMLAALLHHPSIDLPMVLPGISIKPDPETYKSTTRAQLTRWDGSRWVLLGGLVDITEPPSAANAQAEDAPHVQK